MLKEILLEIFERDLLKLQKEINLYADETSLWILKDEISNSAGNLCLHLIGNLNHFIGQLLGHSGYLRHRESEFTSKNVSREELNHKIDETIKVVKTALNQLTDKDFEQDFPEKFQDKIVKTDFMLVHTATHFNYHLGQINYHRRLIS